VPVLNERPRPRALLEALPDEVADAVAPLFPVTRRIDESDELHEAEWDVLVTAASRVRRDPSLNVVAFGSIISDLPYGRDDVLLASQPEGTLLSRSLPSRATELVVPLGVGDVLGMLVREDLAPGFEQQLDKQTLGVLSAFVLALATTMGTASRTVDAVVMPSEMEGLFEPFLVLSHGGILAARYVRSAGWPRQSSEVSREERAGGECWLLPAHVQRHAAWVGQALQHWHDSDPARFPGRPVWWRNIRWATPDQDQTLQDLERVEAERSAALAAYDGRLLSLQQRLSEADEAARGGMQRLLTSDGSDLEDAVAVALRDLGLVVQDMDEVHPPNDRREDARVTDPDLDGWEALVEIKGYTRGAAVNDLARLSRWSTKYALEKQRLPDALWHIVNHFRQQDPETRPRPLPDDADLLNFQEQSGLLIDSLQLFEVMKATAGGRITALAVRESLQQQQAAGFPPELDNRPRRLMRSAKGWRLQKCAKRP